MMTSPDLDLSQLFSAPARRQRYLDVEAALAAAQAEVGLVPREAADAIAAACRLELLDEARMAQDEATTGHIMVPVVNELARVLGPEHGGWVHWGATTQNIQQTGLVLGLRDAHDALTDALTGLLRDFADLGERTAYDVMSGRTHGQHAVPITLGHKVAAWSDAMTRHLERMRQLRPRLLVAMTGGAAGTFAAMGDLGPAVQDGVARRLGLESMTVPSRAITDHLVELVTVLALVAGTGGTIADEVIRLMGTEYGELTEPVPDGDVGSSTMPQKRNAKLSMAVVTAGMQVRGLVAPALESMIQSHEVDGSRSAVLEGCVEQACILSADLLDGLRKVVAGLTVHPERLRANLDLSHGLISAEAVMMALAPALGRQVAHHVVHDAAHDVATQGGTFTDVLLADPRVTAHLDAAAVRALLDPTRHVGLSAQIALDAASAARNAAP